MLPREPVLPMSMRLEPHAIPRPARPTKRALAALSALSILLLTACHERRIGEAPPPSANTSFSSPRPPNRTAPPFSFVVAGHVYGHPSPTSPRPASTLTQGVRLLWLERPDFSVLLGDTVYGWAPNLLGNTLPFLQASLPMPLLHAVGNHELGDPQRNLRVFGPTYHRMDHAGCRLLVLDSETDPWQISGDQLRWLLGELTEARRNPPRALFLFSHRPLWAMTLDTVLTAMLGNGVQSLPVLLASHDGPQSFARNLLPRLREIASHTPVLCFAGDFGAFAPYNMHLFAQRDREQPRLRYFGVGLGDDPQDAFLTVRVHPTSEPEVVATELATGRPLPLADYDHEAWRRRFYPNGLPTPVLQFLLR